MWLLIFIFNVSLSYLLFQSLRIKFCYIWLVFKALSFESFVKVLLTLVKIILIWWSLYFWAFRRAISFFLCFFWLNRCLLKLGILNLCNFCNYLVLCLLFMFKIVRLNLPKHLQNQNKSFLGNFLSILRFKYNFFMIFICFLIIREVIQLYYFFTERLLIVLHIQSFNIFNRLQSQISSLRLYVSFWCHRFIYLLNIIIDVFEYFDKIFININLIDNYLVWEIFWLNFNNITNYSIKFTYLPLIIQSHLFYFELDLFYLF